VNEALNAGEPIPKLWALSYGFKKATQEDLDKIKELIADCYELLPIMKGE
jgi:hypothetical protein